MSSGEKAYEEVLKSAMDTRNQLVIEWNKGLRRDYAKMDQLINTAKILMTKMSSYLPLKTLPETTEKELLLARELLELGARASVAKMAGEQSLNSDEFDRYISQLKYYYFDLGHFIRTPSEFMYEILGMNLLKLLSQNRISEFHLELELFVHPDANKVLNNVYIKKAVEMEQHLREGRYNKILALHTASDEELKASGLVSSGFRYFIEKVIENSREVIGDVIEKTYDQLDIGFAVKALHADKEQFKQLASTRKWLVGNDGFLRFPKKMHHEKELPSYDFMKDALKYAKDLDTII